MKYEDWMFWGPEAGVRSAGCVAKGRCRAVFEICDACKEAKRAARAARFAKADARLAEWLSGMNRYEARLEQVQREMRWSDASMREYMERTP